MVTSLNELAQQYEAEAPGPEKYKALLKVIAYFKKHPEEGRRYIKQFEDSSKVIYRYMGGGLCKYMIYDKRSGELIKTSDCSLVDPTAIRQGKTSFAETGRKPHKIPRYIYHYTEKTNLESICESGLEPRIVRSVFGAKDTPMIWFSPVTPTALDPGDVLLRVDTQLLDKDKFRTFGGSIVYLDNIPPEYITYRYGRGPWHMCEA